MLISQPYRNWKDARSHLSHHAVLQYHKDSMEALNSFVSCFVSSLRHWTAVQRRGIQRKPCKLSGADFTYDLSYLRKEMQTIFQKLPRTICIKEYIQHEIVEYKKRSRTNLKVHSTVYLLMRLQMFRIGSS